MDKINKKTETRRIKDRNQTFIRVINSIFGIIQASLAFRLVFKVFGANVENKFVQLIYRVTEYFIFIFKNIFSHIEIGERGVFEPEIIIAMIVIAIINGIIMKLITTDGRERSVKTKDIKSDEDENI